MKDDVEVGVDEEGVVDGVVGVEVGGIFGQNSARKVSARWAVLGLAMRAMWMFSVGTSLFPHFLEALFDTGNALLDKFAVRFEVLTGSSIVGHLSGHHNQPHKIRTRIINEEEEGDERRRGLTVSWCF